MRPMTTLTSAALLMSVALSCHAGTTAMIRVTARVVHSCTATTDDVVNCPPETPRFASTLRGSANIVTDDGEPSVQFIGPRPVVEKIRRGPNILFQAAPAIAKRLGAMRQQVV